MPLVPGAAAWRRGCAEGRAGSGACSWLPSVGPFFGTRSAYDRCMDNADSQPVPEAPEDLAATQPDGPVEPSDGVEAHPASPEGGRSDGEVDVDPDGAMTANGFISLITIVMLVLVVLVVATALTGSTIMLIVTFIGIITGLGLVLKNLFEMMSTD